MKKFRVLRLEETRVIFLRHARWQDDQTICAEEAQRCRKRGEELAEAGLIIDEVFSSPSPRALKTALYLLEGFGADHYVRTIDFLADLRIEQAEVLREIRSYAKGRGDLEVARFLYANFFHLIKARALSLLRITFWLCRPSEGKTYLISSHGVTRIEPAIKLLAGRPLTEDLRLLDNLGMIELIISADGYLQEENWF